MVVFTTLAPMEARNDDPRVRPIPIDDDFSSEFESVAPTEATNDDGPAKRPWLPLALAGVAVAMVMGTVATFGALQEQDPPPPDAAFTQDVASDEPEAFSPPTTVAVSLQEAVPGVTDRLTLIANGPNGPTALLWDPSFIQPKPLPIEINPDSDNQSATLRSASFDAGGSFVAVTSPLLESDTMLLRIGSPTDLSATELLGTTSHIWHASDVAHLAWIATSPDGLSTLYTARVNPLSTTLMDELEVAEVPSNSSLIRWDTDGFILDTGSGEVLVLTTHGEEAWRRAGYALAASASTILVAPSGADPERLATAAALDRSGTEINVLFDEEVDDQLIGRTVALSGKTGLLARIDVRQERTRIELNGASFAGTRIIQYNDDVEPIGFTSNDKYFVFKADGSNDLVFVNWSLGSFHVLSVPDQFGIVGLDLG